MPQTITEAGCLISLTVLWGSNRLLPSWCWTHLLLTLMLLKVVSSEKHTLFHCWGIQYFYLWAKASHFNFISLVNTGWMAAMQEGKIRWCSSHSHIISAVTLFRSSKYIFCIWLWWMVSVWLDTWSTHQYWLKSLLASLGEVWVAGGRSWLAMGTHNMTT